MTVLPGVPSLAYAHAPNATRLVPTRVVRVGTPPGSLMSNVRAMPRAWPDPSRDPKSIRSSVWSAFFAATWTVGPPIRALTLNPAVFGGTARNALSK